MQIAINILFSASNILLVAIGFSLIFTVSRFFHFAHAVVFTAAAYLTFLFKVWIGLPFLLAVPLALLSTALLGSLIELSFYRPLRRKRASSLILLLASLGIYIVLQNVISILFGDDTKVIRSAAVRKTVEIFGASITSVQIVTIFTAIAALIALSLFLKRTKTGRAIRAVASDFELAMVSGIDSDKVVLWVFAIGSFLAGLAGILVAFDVDMTPTMGMQPLMLAIVAVLVGGMRSAVGIALASLILAMFQQLGAWKLGTQWQDATALVILLGFLLLKPEGVLGKKVKKATI